MCAGVPRASFRQVFGRLDNLRVGRHETIDISPYLQHLGIEHGGDNRCRIVRAATSKVGGLVAVAVAGNEAGYDVDLVRPVCCDTVATNRTEGFLHQLGGQVGVDDVLAHLVFCADEVTAVHADTVLHHGCHDVRREALAIADDGVFRLLRQVVNEVDTIIDALQLVEEAVNIVE